MKKYDPTKGFTLIELLVVIAIISILAAILFPVFAGVREKARATACLSNEKQIGLALLEYNEDYDEVLPPGQTFVASKTSGNPSNYFWMDEIYPYVKNEAVFVCPSRWDSKLNGVDYGQYFYPPSARKGVRYFGDYVLNGAYSSKASVPCSNGYVTDNPCVAGNSYGLPLSGFDAPSNTVYALEGGRTFLSLTNGPHNNVAVKGAALSFDITTFASTWTIDVDGHPEDVWHAPDASGNNYELTVFPHQGRENVLYVDGHAKSIGPSDLFATHLAPDGVTQVSYLFSPAQY